jgi:hypothetical protein
MSLLPTRGAGLGQVFRIPEFRALWFAELVSTAGDQLARVGLSVLVYGRTGSPVWAALTYALTFLPALAGGVLLGRLADRHPRRTVMIVCDLARAALVAAMALPGTPLPAVCALLVAVVLRDPRARPARRRAPARSGGRPRPGRRHFRPAGERMRGDRVRGRAPWGRAESPGAVAHAVLLQSGAGRRGPVLCPDQRVEGGVGCGRIAVDPVAPATGPTSGRRAGRVPQQVSGQAAENVTQRDHPPGECTRSGTDPKGHNSHSIHYSPVLPMLCAGGAMLR